MIEPPPWRTISGIACFIAKKRALEIYREHPVPIAFRHVDHAADFGDTHIIVEDIDAVVSGAAGLDHRGNIGAFADVAAMGRRFAALGSDEAHGLFRGGLIDIGTEHARPFAGEGDCRRLAVSPSRPDRAGADNERDFIFETIGHL
jgi:hypothetical protein